MVSVSIVEQRGCPRDSAFEIVNGFDVAKRVVIRIETESGVLVRRLVRELAPGIREIADCVYDDDCEQRVCVIESAD
jgi:hypothetical protein